MKKKSKFIFIAHRGIYNNLNIPENSMKSFKRAINSNVSIELDIHLTKDNKLVVFHDDNLIRMTGTYKKIRKCIRKEKGAHGIEERGVYHIHQFEKQEMISTSAARKKRAWTGTEKLWRYSVELFRSLDIPVRQLECCSGDLADPEESSPATSKPGARASRSILRSAPARTSAMHRARRLHIRVKGKNGKNYLAHTLNNTCVAPPRMLIAFLGNNLQPDGSVDHFEVLRSYMGGTEVLVPKH